MCIKSLLLSSETFFLKKPFCSFPWPLTWAREHVAFLVFQGGSQTWQPPVLWLRVVANTLAVSNASAAIAAALGPGRPRGPGTVNGVSWVTPRMQEFTCKKRMHMVHKNVPTKEHNDGVLFFKKYCSDLIWILPPVILLLRYLKSVHKKYNLVSNLTVVQSWQWHRPKVALTKSWKTAIWRQLNRAGLNTEKTNWSPTKAE